MADVLVLVASNAERDLIQAQSKSIGDKQVFGVYSVAVCVIEEMSPEEVRALAVAKDPKAIFCLLPVRDVDEQSGAAYKIFVSRTLSHCKTDASGLPQRSLTTPCAGVHLEPRFDVCSTYDFDLKREGQKVNVVSGEVCSISDAFDNSVVHALQQHAIGRMPTPILDCLPQSCEWIVLGSNATDASVRAAECVALLHHTLKNHCLVGLNCKAMK